MTLHPASEQAREPVRARRVARTVGLAAVLALSTSACGIPGLQAFRLPGSVGGSDTYKVTVVLDNALDLVPQSSVHVNDVTVGSVEAVNLDGFQARVVCLVKNNVVLPANTTARLEQTSLLGEKFISLQPPTTGATGRLQDGAVIPTTDTSRSAEVEEVFSALSELLNGGGVQQLQIISSELSAALTGREANVQDVLKQLNTLVSQLNGNRDNIVRALDNIDRLATTLSGSRDVIAEGLDKIAPGLKVLADETDSLSTLLTKLSDLGAVGTRVANASRVNTVKNLQALQPTLTALARAGEDIPNAIEMLVVFPFGDNARRAIFSDFTGLKATLDLDLSRTLGPGNPMPAPSLPVTVPTTVPSLPVTVPGLPGAGTNGAVPVPVPTPSVKAPLSDLGNVLRGVL